ncbi:MAG TPA: sulfate ABC transporter permease subunit CysW [Planctomicrobium sp.]|nr:sulfate ABC transporter permease subunit CysW [Planctomicrobium sp.]
MQIKHHHSARVSPAVPREPLWLRILLIAAAYFIIIGLILVPLIYVFYQALSPGWDVFWANLVDDHDTRHSIWLTMTVAPVAVVCNTIFGVAAAWTITKFRFPGRTLLITLLDVPFAISPVVAGLMFVLLFGLQGYFGEFLRDNGIKIIFAWPGLVIATMFITMPFIARELIPLMQSLGSDEELAAVSLGANPWQLFWRITLPNIKWGLLYGIIQCNARAIGEFGAVYVVSGHIAGETDTMPLRVEKLFQEYNNPGSFAVATVLTLMALSTLILKVFLEQWIAAQESARLKEGEQ